MSRITPGTMTVGIMAVLFGLVGAYGVRRFTQPEPKPVVAQPPRAQASTDVFAPLAATDLVPDKKLAISDIMIVRMSREDVRERGLPSDYMTNPQQIAGRMLKKALKKGDPFVTTDLYSEGMGPNLAERLKPGLRAVTIPMESVDSVGGLAGPGSIVDVLFRTNGKDGIPETTVMLMEGVEVLAVNDVTVPGSRVNGNGNGHKKSVTLAVSGPQAAALMVVEGRGDLSLSLRKPGDEVRDASYRPSPLTLESLLGIPPKRAPFRAEIYRGTSRQTITFDEERVSDERFGGTPVTKADDKRLGDDRTDTAPRAQVP